MKKEEKKKEAPILVQMGIFAAILFASQLISNLFPKSFVVPTPLIGMILLYILLACHIVKLEQVEKFGDFMISLIAFLFVPSGIQLAGSLGLMKRRATRCNCYYYFDNYFISSNCLCWSILYWGTS